jgi:competence protein ComEA
MLKKILAILAFMLYAATSFAAVDVNKATAAELDGLKGIGPVMSKRILDERKKGEFKSWDDLIARVNGIATTKATSLSKEGLTVAGAAFKPAASAQKDAKEVKKEAKEEAKADKKDAKAEAKADKKEVKAEMKAEKKEEKKEEKAVAKDAKKDDKTAVAAKPAASTKK